MPFDHDETRLTPEHVRQVGACLELLAQAQALCNLAAGQLCPVPGFGDEWSELSRPHDAIKRAWHVVEKRRLWLLDRERQAAAELAKIRRRLPPIDLDQQN